jgi:hypothetical protein
MIIGLSGYAQSGKDTIAEILVTEGFTRIAFADIMREALLALNPYAGKYRLQEYVSVNTWDVAKVSMPEVRRLLQYFGTDVGRELFGEDFWIQQLKRRYDLYDPTKNWVISDCRFLNEAEEVKLLGGVMWRVLRPGNSPVNDHVSDQGLGYYKFDHVFNNDSSLSVLMDSVKAALKDLNES